MKISFKISLATILFSLYIIISASFMQQLMVFIRYDLFLPKKITIEKFENLFLPNIKEKKIKEKLLNAYTKADDDKYYKIKKEIPQEEKNEALYILQTAGLKNYLSIFIWAIFTIAAILLVIFFIKSKPNFIRLLILAIFFSAGILYAYSINKYIVERIHVIQFGLLGFLFSMDNLEKKGLWTILLSFMWALIIATLDETFQHFLPYRFGHVHDIIFGILGALWGTLIYVTIKYKLPAKQKV